MSMTSSMCVSMTGRPTRLQIANEQRRRRYINIPTETRRGLKCTSCKCYIDNICRNVDSYHYDEEGNLDICKYIQVDRTHDDDNNENIYEF